MQGVVFAVLLGVSALALARRNEVDRSWGKEYPAEVRV